MAVGKDTFRRNGYVLTWASAVVKVDNDEFFGFTGIDLEEKLTKGIAKALGQVPRGRGRGEYSVEGAVLKCHKDTAFALKERLALKSPDGKSFGNVPFFFSLQYIENDITVTEKLYECEIDGVKRSSAPGTDPLIEEIPISIGYVKVDGPNIKDMTLFDNRKGRY
jgi:hypothetical protein